MTLADIKPFSDLPFHGVLLPTITIDPAHLAAAGSKPDATNAEFLRQLCRVGYRTKVAARIPADKQQVYVARVKEELDAIETLGFTNYILMVWDICRFADEAAIPRGPGRGSVSSSLVCHLIGVTELDPIENGLFFTRFLSKSRAKTKVVNGITYCDGGLVPDVDMDFDYYRRAEVFEYIGKRYPGQTAKTLTTTTLTSKALIADVLKVYENAPIDQAMAASDLVEKEAGVPEDVEQMLYGDKDWQETKGEKGTSPNERFKEWAVDHQETCEIAMAISGLNRSEGQHASALLICAYQIEDIMPLQTATDKEGNRHVVSGFDMYSAQEIVLKFDILGLKTLSVIDDACRLLKMDPKSIDVHSSSIYRFLQDFRHRYGIFQLETFAQGNAAAKVKPRNFEQLGAVLAIARPGAFAYIDQFVTYVNEGKYTAIHPIIDPTLKPTGGVCVYQEQYLKMLVDLGMHPDDAEFVRKVIGKKLIDKIPEAEAKVTKVCAENGHSDELAKLLLKIARDSAKYQFNASHSLAYGMLTARSIYLKVHYPVEFWWAVLRMNRREADKHEKLGTVVREMRATGLTLLPPQLTSDLDFRIESPNTIRYALGMVRGISDKSHRLLETFLSSGIKEGATKFDVFIALKNAGLNVGAGCAMIQAGCMDQWASFANEAGEQVKSRSRLVLELCTWNLLKGKDDSEKRNCLAVGARPEVQWDVFHAIKYLNEVAKDEKGRPLMKDSRRTTIRKHYQPYKEVYEMNSRNEQLADYWYEKHVLGYSYSHSLRSIFGEHVDGLMTVEEMQRAPVGTKGRLIGFVKEPFKGKTKKGNAELKLTLTDETGEIRYKAFNEKIDAIEEGNGRSVTEGDLIVCAAKKMEGDTLFAEWGVDGLPVRIQTTRIYMKLSELEKDRAQTKPVAEPEPVAVSNEAAPPA